MDIDENPRNTPPPQPQVLPQVANEQPSSMSLSSVSSACTYNRFALSPTPQPCSIFAPRAPPRRRAIATSTSGFQTQSAIKEVAVKVHVRRPDKDNWAYVGRAVVNEEVFGQGTRIGAQRSCLPLSVLTDHSTTSCESLNDSQGHHRIQPGMSSVLSSCDRTLHPSQGTPIQAEKRGNFVVVSCTEGTRVVAWSLNVSSFILPLQCDGPQRRARHSHFRP